MKNRGWLLLSAIMCAGLLGCTVQAGDAAGENGETTVVSTSQPIIGGWATGIFRWEQGQPPVTLESATTHVCVLTGLGGFFAGTGEWVKVDVPAGSSSWVLRGNSAQNSVFGEAACFPMTGFISVGSQFAHFYSVEASANAWSRGNNASTSLGGGCQQAQVDSGTGRAFAFLEGMQGEMAGAGEFSVAIQSPSVNTFNVIRSQICTDGTHIAYGRNLLVSPYATFLAKYMNAAGTRGDLNAIPDFETQAFRNRNFSVRMARVDQAMCAFTRIQGKFFGNKESVTIRSDGTSWIMSATAGAGSDTVRAGARCFARDQR